MSPQAPPRKPAPRDAFSLVEMLIVVVILGIITFIAIPNVVQVKRDSEDSRARALAEALNVAGAGYFQSVGRQSASQAWATADNSGRYNLVRPYLAFAPATLAEYVPAGYSMTFTTAPLENKVVLQRTDGTAVPY